MWYYNLLTHEGVLLEGSLQWYALFLRRIYEILHGLSNCSYSYNPHTQSGEGCG